MNWEASREDERTYSSPLTVIKYLCLRLNYIRNCYILTLIRKKIRKIYLLNRFYRSVQ